MQMTLLRHLRHENVIAVVDIMAPPTAQVRTPTLVVWLLCWFPASAEHLWGGHAAWKFLAHHQNLQRLAHQLNSCIVYGRMFFLVRCRVSAHCGMPGGQVC